MTRINGRTFVLACALLTVCSFGNKGALALSVEIEQGHHECFTVHAEDHHDTLVVRYVVEDTGIAQGGGEWDWGDGGATGLDVSVTRVADEATIYYRQSAEEDDLHVAIEGAGSYTLCFLAPHEEALVRFSLNTRSSHMHAGKAQAAADRSEKGGVPVKSRDVEDLGEELGVLADMFMDVLDDQRFTKARQRVMHDTLRSMDRKVLWWSVCEALAIGGAGLAKVHYIQRKFAGDKLRPRSSAGVPV